jgi:arylsulfatase A-like enzyme
MRHLTRREFMKNVTFAGSLITVSSIPGVLPNNWTDHNEAHAANYIPGSNDFEKPNLLVVFPDEMRAHAMGFMNEDPVITPNIDKFASESLVLTQAVSNYPLCSPFRSMLMTGKYPPANNVPFNCTNLIQPYGYELRTSERCLSDVLKDSGYCCGYIGKWHLDNPYKPYVSPPDSSEEVFNEWCPPERRHGFDFWYGSAPYGNHGRPMYWDTNALRDEPSFAIQWSPEHEADKAIDFISNTGRTHRDPNKPFALFVAFNPPHSPYINVPQKYLDQYSEYETEDFCNRPNIPPDGTEWGNYYRMYIRNYLSMVTGVDKQFGRILNALESNDLDKNTIVLFTSDHGNCLGIHNAKSKNNCYEESMRVPFILRWPEFISPRHDDLLISSPDIYPTLLELLGVSTGIPGDVHGTNHAKTLLTGYGIRPTSQLYIGYNDISHLSMGRRGVRTLSHTLLVTKNLDGEKRLCLYDNINDPYQLRNIANWNQDIIDRLVTNEMNPWMEYIKDPWFFSK